MSLKKKVVWLPYDMDTANGINNDGELVFDYQLEDIDYQRSGAPIFNGQESVIWKNIRAAFGDELKTMYQNLRSSGALSYVKVEQMFEEHQSKWSEAIFNEDSQFKYIEPFVNQNANYLYMLLGSKEEQRKWWLYNRFRYIDSKYIAGDARSDSIFLRPYAAADITLTPYADIYATIAWDAKITQSRAQRNVPVTLICPYQSMNGNIVTIYSSSQLALIGDLSPLQIGQIDISNATRLQALKIGSSAFGYDNSNLYSLTFGSNVLLKTVDVRNCSGLGDTSLQGHTQTTVDLSGCSILEEVYFDGTNIQGVTLPNGGVLKILHLPSTITNLTIINQKSITDLSVPSYSSLTTLRLENVPNVDTKAILNAVPAGTRVRLIGFSWEAADATEIEALLDRLDTMRGLNESGETISIADGGCRESINGTIHTGSLTGTQIASYQARYPYLTVTADSVTSYLTYASYDGTTTYKTVTCSNGVPQDTAPSNPTRPATAQNTFTFVGWSKSMNATTADADAETNVIADRTIYAAYSAQVRTYTVYFYNGSTLLETDTGVPYGGSTTYDGATPVDPSGQSLPFEKWEPAPTNIVGDTSCYAQFQSPVVVEEITDSWDTIIANIDNGTYSSVYKVGNYKPLDLGTEGTINMQIVAMDADELASGGTAPLTFIGMELLATTHRMNPANSSGAIGTGGNGGWENCEMRSYLTSTILPLITTASATVASRLQRVKKVQSTVTDGTMVIDGQTTTDDVWIPSNHEIFGTTTYESTGPVYTTIYNNATARIKYRDGSANYWWVRSASSTAYFRDVNTNGVDKNGNAYYTNGVALGFCLGLEPETIEDSWSTMLANTNPSATYSIGDTKMIDLGTEGTHLMEIVAFGEDDKADGSGKAKITWISKDLLNTTHRMNPANSSGAIGTGGNGGWENCEMRTYLKNTIKPLIPAEVRNAIVEVTKIQSTVTDGTMVTDGQTTTDDVWIPSNHEIFGTTTYESTGAVYTTKFNSATNRIKKRNGSADTWWVRSASSTTNFRNVNTGGGGNSFAAYYTLGVALGFCTD